MFRFTIRELLSFTLSVGLALGWWIDHRRQAEAAEDARMLAHFSVRNGMCGNEAMWFSQLQAKYGAVKVEWDDGTIDNPADFDLIHASK